MWIAGLRGAMAYALGLSATKEFKSGQVMLIITLLYSLFTILGVSSFLYPIMNYCEVTNSAVPAQRSNQLEQELMINVKAKGSFCTRLKESMSRFDRFYFSPLFIKESSSEIQGGRSETMIGQQSSQRDHKSSNMKI